MERRRNCIDVAIPLQENVRQAEWMVFEEPTEDGSASWFWMNWYLSGRWTGIRWPKRRREVGRLSVDEMAFERPP